MLLLVPLRPETEILMSPRNEGMHFFFLVSIDISTGDSGMQYVVQVLSHCPKNMPSE